jgi:hypothetical protein
LSGKDARNVDSVSGRGADAIEMRDKSSADGGMSEVALHHVELVLSVTFPLV